MKITSKQRPRAKESVKNHKNVSQANGDRQYGYGRFAAERVMGMHRQIEDKRYPNASSLAREFEVSVRTIKRDIHYMKERLTLPLAFDVPRNGIYFTKPVPHLPQIPLTEREMFHLFIASQALAQYEGT